MTSAPSYLSLLRDLHALTAAIGTAAAGGLWPDLLGLLEQRQAVMDQIDALPDAARVLPEAERQEAARLLEGVAEADRRSMASVDSSMAAIRPELQAGEAARTTISAYQRSARVPTQLAPARFVDKQR
ncbi:MAG TPA: flagellar protein FliT [Symbiobacteriaceae bacterium]|jgi:hypothetical protein|nr:flagellar protein FliT [Symbiobacteriaceae bacterium]